MSAAVVRSPSMTRPRTSSRALSALLTGCLALETAVVEAAPPDARSDANRAHAEASELVEQSRALERTAPRDAAGLLSKAAELWGSILEIHAESAQTHELREQAYCNATEALLDAYRLAADPMLVDRGLTLSEAYTRELRKDGATPPPYSICDWDERSREFAALRPGNRASQPPPDRRPVVLPVRRRWPEVAMWTSVGLAVGSGAAALGTSLALRHDPDDPTDQGPVYKKIQAAVADRPDLNQEGTNLCRRDVREDVRALAGPCRTYDAWIATTTLFAVASLSTAVFMGLVLRDRARRRRGEVPTISASPTLGGAFLQLHARF